MNRFIKTDPWKIIEERFDPERVLSSESLFSIGNGTLGQRANFEEKYSGKSLPGSYIGGVYYPDKTRVGWWKNGYPDYFAKVLNSAFWIGIGVKANGREIDLAVCRVHRFYRELDMKRGVLTRSVEVETPEGLRLEIEAIRFISLVRPELGAISYRVTPLNGAAGIELSPYIDADVRNQDANYDEKFWEYVGGDERAVQMRTKKTGFEVCWSMCNILNGTALEPESSGEIVSQKAVVQARKGVPVQLYKYVGIVSSLNYRPEQLISTASMVASDAAISGFDNLLYEHAAAWQEIWNHCDIVIEGDPEAQQGIRYCTFMLLQTYTGSDSRLNIGPKGFTGEKYGGSTYWDTEAYCLPFYLSTAGAQVARQLLVYRYHHLDKAIENAVKLGFSGGAALYPMVTMNGEESHNEWEITFEEIHRNGAIAYAIYNYIRYTGDRNYLAEYGLEVLWSIARFWEQRVNFSEHRNQYVMLGVTGPNEYENNVNNNWYTGYIALWCMRYAEESARWVAREHPSDWARIVSARRIDLEGETARWRRIAANMYLPEDSQRGIFLQQDGYLDKEQVLVKDLDPSQRPLNRHWSWDRILRSCFIKQADVLQGLYFFEDDFDLETIRRNFHFYEQRTVHESSLSPCVHAILACRIGDMDKAYEMYLRTARLDLDDYNKEIEEGLHITSMAGSWLSVVQGYGGMRVHEGMLCFTPTLAKGWKSLSFKLLFRGRTLKIRFTRQGCHAELEAGEPMTIRVNDSLVEVGGSSTRIDESVR